MYDSPEDCEKQIKAFAKQYARVGMHRYAIKRNKLFSYADAVQKLDKGVFTPEEMAYFASGDVQATIAKMFKKPAKPTPKL